MFSSPLPNPALWTNATIRQFITPDFFANGGWWHDTSILAATGEGFEKEEPRAWQGWWNESIVELVELSMAQKDALTVLLTGRGEIAFQQLIRTMVASKKLDFDMICLKPAMGPDGTHFSSTQHFKQTLLRKLVHTYGAAEKLLIYEDRLAQ